MKKKFTLFLRITLLVTLVFAVSQHASSQLVINEFMASNDSWAIPGEIPGDEFPDWIEIYNTGDADIDMAGWYATDDLSDLIQWQFPFDMPELTVVPAQGYLLLLCDKLDTINGALHTNFKLSGSAEELAISQDGVTIIDGYTYCEDGCDLPSPGTDNSAGRNGDGAGLWIVYLIDSDFEPSPGTANDFVVSVNSISKADFTPLSVYPNPTTGSEVDFNKNVNIQIYNLTGQMLFADKHVSRLDVSQFNSGLYLIQTDEGELVKLIVK